jgi:dTDP-4-amino-4,6-dideoxygalactose transaminase
MRLADVATRPRFIDHMAAVGIRVVFHYQPLHLSEVGQRYGGRPGQHPVTEGAGDDLVRLPHFGALTEVQVNRVVERVISFFPSG